MTLKKAITTTLEDWLRRDPEWSRLYWLAGTLLLAPIVPVIIAARIPFKQPERNPDYRPRR